MIQDSGLSVRDVLRKNVDAYTELNLDDANWTNEQLLDAMLEHPILIQPSFRRDRFGHSFMSPI